MTSESLARAEPETIRRIQQNLIGYFGLFEGLPGVTFAKGEVTLVASTGYPGSLVLGSSIQANAANETVHRTLQSIEQRCSAIDWFVFPECEPSDLGDRLVTLSENKEQSDHWSLVGKIGGPGGTWMLAALNALAPQSRQVSSAFHVENVTDLEHLETWKQINAEGFGGGDYQIFYDAFARHGFGPDAIAHHFVGYLDDTPVTSATLILAGGIASVFNVSTPERLRRQGYGGAVTLAALQAAIGYGFEDAYVWSSPLGRSVYQNLGFEIRDVGIREYQWEKSSDTA
jgi:hypothetical protein